MQRDSLCRCFQGRLNTSPCLPNLFNPDGQRSSSVAHRRAPLDRTISLLNRVQRNDRGQTTGIEYCCAIRAFDKQSGFWLRSQTFRGLRADYLSLVILSITFIDNLRRRPDRLPTSTASGPDSFRHIGAEILRDTQQVQ